MAGPDQRVEIDHPQPDLIAHRLAQPQHPAGFAASFSPSASPPNRSSWSDIAPSASKSPTKRKSSRAQFRKSYLLAPLKITGSEEAAKQPSRRMATGTCLWPWFETRCCAPLLTMRVGVYASGPVRDRPSAPARPAGRIAVRAARGRGRAGRARARRWRAPRGYRATRRMRPEVARIARERAHRRDRVDGAVRPRAGQRRARDGAPTGSTTTRMAASGTRCRAAASATMCDSISTASAPVASCRRRLSSACAIGCARRRSRHRPSRE